MLVEILSLLLTIGCLFLTLLFIRNDRVYHYRMKVINKIYTSRGASRHEDGSTGSTLGWHILRAVSYEEMVYKFWRPLDSFFPPEYRP